MLLPNLRKMDILVFVSAAAQSPASQHDHDGNHSTISNITTMSGWLGTYIVASNRASNLKDPITKEEMHFWGGASIWNVDGKLLSQAPVIGWLDSDDSSIVYAEISKQNYQNEIKKYWLEHRRPELYRNYSSFRFEKDANKNTVGTTVLALLVQYSPEYGNKSNNYNKIQELVFAAKQAFNLLVLPFNSLIGGAVDSLVDAKKFAEDINGDTTNKMIDLAKKTRSFVVYSLVELGMDDKLYLTSIMLTPQGEIAGAYRKSHLNSSEQSWATAGNDLPVFKTAIGNIAMVLNDEVRIPEITDIYAIKRSDIIIVSTDYSNSQYGGPVLTPKHMLVLDYSNQAMFIWHNMARYSQTHVLVANYANEKNTCGASGLYYPNPEMGFYPPDLIDSSNKEQAYLVAFHNKPDPLNWISQESLILGRRDTLATPLLLSKNSKLLNQWQDNSQDVLFS
jgi:predicted amidohydrolase